MQTKLFSLISCQNIFFIFLFTICNIWSYLAKSPASTVNETRCFGASCRKFFLCLNIYRAPNPGEPPTPIPSPLTQILTLPHTHFTVHTQLPCFKYISWQCWQCNPSDNKWPSQRPLPMPPLFIIVIYLLHFIIYIYLRLMLVCLFVCYFVCFFVHLVVMFPDTNGLPLLLATGHQQRHCVLFTLYI